MLVGPCVTSFIPPVTLFIRLCKLQVAQTFESVDGILSMVWPWFHINPLQHDTIYLLLRFNFRVCRRNSLVWPLKKAPVLFSILQNRICEHFSGILILEPTERVNYTVSSDTWIGPMPCRSSFSRLGVIFSGNEPITTRFEGLPPLDAFVTTTRFAFESGAAPDDLVLLSEGPTTIRC